MINDLNLEIKNFGPINEANIEINKINVLGGINSCGKSTIGRILYCFLKTNFLNKRDNVKKILIDEINCVVNNPPMDFTIDDDFNEIISEYEKYANNNSQITTEKDKYAYIETLRNLLNLFDSYDDATVSSKILKELFFKESLIGFEGYSKIHAPSFSSIIQINQTISAENIRNIINNSNIRLKFESVDLFLVNHTNGSLNFSNNIFYIDSFSILNMFNYLNSKVDTSNIEGFIGINDHIGQLITDIFDIGAIGPIMYDPIYSPVINRIDEMLNGFFFADHITEDFKFHIDDLEFRTNNTSSGIKQIGIIQLLLQKEKLKPGSFLIIDEPEVNLHPEWQFKFAQVLVLLAKELDITIYINSHSPSFIESIDAFTEYYDMQNDINYYLAEESEVEEKYNFNKIESNELYRIYTNLGNVYKLVDKLRLKKRLNR